MKLWSGRGKIIESNTKFLLKYNKKLVKTGSFYGNKVKTIDIRHFFGYTFGKGDDAMIVRPQYMDILKKYRNVKLVKILAGIRRCGKLNIIPLGSHQFPA